MQLDPLHGSFEGFFIVVCINVIPVGVYLIFISRYDFFIAGSL